MYGVIRPLSIRPLARIAKAALLHDGMTDEECNAALSNAMTPAEQAHYHRLFILAGAEQMALSRKPA